MVKSNSYYRARKEVLQSILQTANNPNQRFYRNGYVPIQERTKFAEKLKHFNETASNEPLSFAEITSFSTWFTMHPEKMAGEEVETTSLQFPLKLKGGKKDIERMFARVFTAAGESEAEALALALKLELELIDFNGLNGVEKLRKFKKNKEYYKKFHYSKNEFVPVYFIRVITKDIEYADYDAQINGGIKTQNVYLFKDVYGFYFFVKNDRFLNSIIKEELEPKDRILQIKKNKKKDKYVLKTKSIGNIFKNNYLKPINPFDYINDLDYRSVVKTISFDDYFKCTVVEFEPKIVYSRKNSKEEVEKYWTKLKDKYKNIFVSSFGSEYIQTSKGIYRKADHWGGVGSCFWKLNKESDRSYAIGYADLNSFYLGENGYCGFEIANPIDKEVQRLIHFYQNKNIKNFKINFITK